MKSALNSFRNRPALFCLLVVALGTVVTLSAQIAPASEPKPEDGTVGKPRTEEMVVTLDAFTVTAVDMRGYRAENSASGTLVSTPIKKLPASIQVVTEQFIQDQDSRRVEDSIRYVSGVGLSARNEGSRGGTRSEVFVIRGFETSQVLRNGVRLQGLTNSANLERIEVLKGPSSIFFGASDPGGLVNYITKQPREGTFGSVKASIARYDGYYGEFDFNTPLAGKNKVLFRVTGSFLDSDGWRKFWHDEQQFINPVLVWNVSPTTRLSFDTQYRKQTGIQERLGDVFLTTNNPAPFSQRLLTGDALARSVAIGALTPTDTYHEVATASLVKLTQMLGSSTVVQINYGFSEADREQRVTVTRNRLTLPTFTYADRPGYLELEGVNNTLNINILHDFTLFGAKHKLLGGWDRNEVGQKDIFVLYSPTSVNSTVRGFFDNLSEADLYSVKRYPTFAEIGNADIGLISNQPFTKTWDQGFYITDQVSLLEERLTVIGGARYSTLREQNLHKTTPQIGANFALNKEWTFYALYSESFRPNGRSDNRDPNSSFLKPETGEGLEVGTKVSLFKDKLTGSIALFDVKKKNIRRLDSGAIVQGLNGVALSDGEESKGVEIDFVFTPTRDFTAIFAYAHTDAKIVSDVINSSSSPDLDGDGIADSVGLPLKGVSPNTYSLWMKYDFRGESLKGLSLGAGYQYREGPIPHDASFARRLVTQDSYYRLDLLASYSTPVFGKLTKFQLNLDNVTDQFYADKSLGYAHPFMWRFSIGMDF